MESFTTMHTESSPRERRVLLITVRADHGGGPRHILDLLTAFGSVNASSSVGFYIAAPNQQPYADRFKAKCRMFIEIPARRFSVFSLMKLWKLVLDEKIDVIHSHGRGAGLYSRILGLLLPVRVIHTFHGIHRETSLHGRIKLWIDKVLAFVPFTPVFVSPNEQDEAHKFGVVRPDPENRHTELVVENAVDLSRFITSRRTSSFDSGSPLRIGTILRNDPAKGPDLFAALVETTSAINAEWSCVGISHDELAYSAQGETSKAFEMIVFVGRLPDPASWLQSLDIYVSTSRTEGLPIGVLEAMAAETICVLSDIPAHQMFANKNAALLFDPNHPATFVEPVKRLLANPNLRERLRTNASALIRERHSLANFRSKLEPFYQGLRS